MATIGKSIYVWILMLAGCAQAYINLEITGFDGRKITQAAVGEDFVIKISTDQVDRVHDIVVEGVQQFTAQKTGLSLITVNNNKSAQVTYRARADRAGIYTIGPALIPQQEQSERVSLKVLAERITDTASLRQHAAAREQVFLRLSVDKDSVYVGQKMQALLRAYIPDGEDITLDQVISNDPDTIETTDKIGQKKETEMIEGKRYTVLSWKWDMFATEPGELIIPAYFIDYAKALPAQHGFGGLAIFFGPQYERKRVYSNALTIQVKPLAQSENKDGLVGTFSSYRAELKPSVSKKYEGAILALTLEGNGNMHKLIEPSLENIPAVCRYYFSKSDYIPGAVENRKTFEFVLQGMQEGEWEIPPQRCTFFDTEKECYVSLQTDAVTMTVLPDAQMMKSIDLQDMPNELADKKNVEYMLFHDDLSSAAVAKPLSIKNFLFLFLAPFFLLCAKHVYRFGTCRYSKAYRRKSAFARARKAIERSRKNHDVQSLPHIFTILVKDRFGDNGIQGVESLIATGSWSKEKKDAWQQFYYKIMQAGYAGDSSLQEKKILFDEAIEWLHNLEELCS